MLDMKEKNLVFGIINHCKRIEETLNKKTKIDFDKNQDIRDIVCFNILQIGELAKNLSPSFISKYDNVPWREIKGMRDWVAHGYGTIDFDTIWKTAVEDIMHLKEYCEFILNNDK